MMVLTVTSIPFIHLDTLADEDVPKVSEEDTTGQVTDQAPPTTTSGAINLDEDQQKDDVESTVPADEKPIEVQPEEVNPVSDMLVGSDAQTPTEAFESFKLLFEAKELDGESVIPFAYMNDHGFADWKAYKEEKLIKYIADWKALALQDNDFTHTYVIDMLVIRKSTSGVMPLNEEGDTLISLTTEGLTEIYNEKKNEITLDKENYLSADLEELIFVDQLGTALGLAEALYSEQYVDLTTQAVIQMISEKWENSNEISYYQEVIYALAKIDVDKIPEGALADKLTQSISKVIGDMAAQSVSVESRFELYANLDSKKLKGEFLNVYRHIVDQKRGMIGWYYTGVNSEDYDHDADGIEHGSSIFQEDQLVALKLEERGSDFNIRRALFGLYDEALEKERMSPSYYRGLKKVVYKAYLSVPETENYAFKFYLDGQPYSDEDYRVKFSLLDKEQVQMARERDNIWSAQLNKNKLYPIEMTIYAQDTDAHLPDHIQLKWSYGNKGEEVIKNRYFFVDNKENLTSKESIDIRHLDPIGDADMDGIPNAWEMEGFVVLGNTIRKYNEKLHKGMKVYYTSPVDKSTDGDPYTDLEEVIGANVTGVTDAGHHPLIAAYPEIVAELVSVNVNARMVDKFSHKETESTATLLSTGNTTVNKHTSKTDESKGFSVGVHIDQSAGYAQTPVSGGIKLTGSASVSVGGKYEKLNDSEDVTTTIGSTAAATNKDADVIDTLIRSTDTFRSGDLTFGIRLKNIGSASAYDITPNISLYIGSEVGRNTPAFTTVEVPGDFYDLAPGQSSQVLNIETRRISESSNRQLALTVNQEVMEKILKGYPVSMQMNNASSKVIVDGNTRGNWDKYVNNISGITATINHQDAANGLKKYKVFAARKNDNYRPQVNVGQALHNIYGDGFVIEDRTNDGVDNPRAFINGKYITNINVYADDVAQLNEYFNGSNHTYVNIFNFPLRPNMIVDVETSTSDETKPFILNTLYKRDKVSAYVLGNCSEVESVKATIATTQGPKEVALTKSADNSLLYEYTFAESPAVDIKGNSIVTASDKNGNIATAELYIANASYLKDQIDKEAFGSRYKALDQDYRITKKAEALTFINQHQGQAYVVYRKTDKVWSHSRPTKIYSRKQMEDFGDLQYDLGYFGELFIQGYFGDTGDKYKPVASQNYAVYLRNGQSSKKFNIYTGINNATGYVVMAGSSTRANMEKGTELKIGDRNYKFDNWGAEIISSNMFFIKADKADPSRITGEIKVPNKDSKKRFDVQVVGYFTQEGGLNYKPLDNWINVQTVASNERSVVKRQIDESVALLEPQAYVIRVQGSNISNEQGKMALEINGVKLSQSRADSRKGNFRAYVIVPKGVNPRELSLKMINPSDRDVANYNLDVVGYFY